MKVMIDPGVLQKLTVEGATIQLAEIGVTVPQHAFLTLMVQEILDQQLQGQFKQDQAEEEQKGLFQTPKMIVDLQYGVAQQVSIFWIIFS